MKIYTSYLNSKAPAERKVCIAKSARFFKGKRVKEFAPSNPWAEGDWRASFRADMDLRFGAGSMLNLEEFVLSLHRSVPNPILCCHERDPRDCHRSVLSAYLLEKLGLEVEEWDEGCEPRESGEPREA